jgi:flagellar biosynthesis/type III secretory pathway M-ring protein FliF/YscJ
MLHFLLFIFLIFVLIILFGLMFIGNIVRSIFHLGRPRGNNAANSNSQQENYAEDEQPKKQIFSDDEGEYVDFEEIKEDKEEKNS